MTNRNIGKEIISGLRAFADDIKSGKKITEKYTCRKVVLDLHPVAYDHDRVKSTRKVLGLSQALFAQFLGVSRKTLQAWEQGVNQPHLTACRLFDEIHFDPEYWRNRVRDLITEKEQPC